MHWLFLPFLESSHTSSTLTMRSSFSCFQAAQFHSLVICALGTTLMVPQGILQYNQPFVKRCTSNFIFINRWWCWTTRVACWRRCCSRWWIRRIWLYTSTEARHEIVPKNYSATETENHKRLQHFSSGDNELLLSPC